MADRGLPFDQMPADAPAPAHGVRLGPADQVLINAAAWFAVAEWESAELASDAMLAIRDALPYVSRHFGLIGRLAACCDEIDRLFPHLAGVPMMHAISNLRGALAEVFRWRMGHAHGAFMTRKGA